VRSRARQLAAERADRVATHVIGRDEQDVWFGSFRARCIETGDAQKAREKKEKENSHHDFQMILLGRWERSTGFSIRGNWSKSAK
jgi:hypothetical protein